MQQAHIFVSGFVQGIGFRAFVKSHAQKLGLTGWVRNTEDGRVEAVFQGSHSLSSGQAKEAIEEMISLCNKGPFLSEVTEIDVAWGEKTEQFSSFEIAHNL